MTKSRLTITEDGTDNTITLVRSVDYRHPAWVHQQLGTASEEELQAALSNYGPDAIGLGPDNCGVEVTS